MINQQTNILDAKPKLLDGDSIFPAICKGAAYLMVLIMLGVFVLLVHGAIPALEKFGATFVWREVWDPVAEQFGAATAIYGTLVSSLIAMLLAFPVGLAIAVFLAEIAPSWLSRPLGILIELLAAIPSIIFGMWGLFVFAPWFSNGFQMWALTHLASIPIVGTLFSGPPIGIGLLTAGIILAIMILPLLTSLIRDALLTISSTQREAGYGLGCTRWELFRHILLPAVKGPVIGASILALGRALGETMAVAFVIGGAQTISGALFMPGTTISASIANQFNEATGVIYPSSLMALGLVLFVISVIILAVARRLLKGHK